MDQNYIPSQFMLEIVTITLTANVQSKILCINYYDSIDYCKNYDVANNAMICCI